jgi:hypothetical protein
MFSKKIKPVPVNLFPCKPDKNASEENIAKLFDELLNVSTQKKNSERCRKYSFQQGLYYRHRIIQNQNVQN